MRCESGLDLLERHEEREDSDGSMVCKASRENVGCDGGKPSTPEHSRCAQHPERSRSARAASVVGKVQLVARSGLANHFIVTSERLQSCELVRLA